MKTKTPKQRHPPVSLLGKSHAHKSNKDYNRKQNKSIIEEETSDMSRPSEKVMSMLRMAELTKKQQDNLHDNLTNTPPPSPVLDSLTLSQEDVISILKAEEEDNG